MFCIRILVRGMAEKIVSEKVSGKSYLLESERGGNERSSHKTASNLLTVPEKKRVGRFLSYWL
jgi:hypothetical protein